VSTSASAPRGGAAVVTTSGLAQLEAGEIVLPAAGSEAQAERVVADERTVIHYHFPVEIEVVSAREIDPDELADHALARLARHLDRFG